MARQINRSIAEDAAYREQDQRDAVGYGLGLMLGGAAMGETYAIRALRCAASAAAQVPASDPLTSPEAAR